MATFWVANSDIDIFVLGQLAVLNAYSVSRYASAKDKPDDPPRDLPLLLLASAANIARAETVRKNRALRLRMMQELARGFDRKAEMEAGPCESEKEFSCPYIESSWKLEGRCGEISYPDPPFAVATLHAIYVLPRSSSPLPFT